MKKNLCERLRFIYVTDNDDVRHVHCTCCEYTPSDSEHKTSALIPLNVHVMCARNVIGADMGYAYTLQ